MLRANSGSCIPREMGEERRRGEASVALIPCHYHNERGERYFWVMIAFATYTAVGQKSGPVC